MPNPETLKSQAEKPEANLNDQIKTERDHAKRQEDLLTKAGIDIPDKPTDDQILEAAKENMVSELPLKIREMIREDGNGELRVAQAFNAQTEAFAAIKNPKEAFTKAEKGTMDRFDNLKRSDKDRMDMENFLKRQPKASEII